MDTNRTHQASSTHVSREIRCPLGPKKLLAKMRVDPNADLDAKRIVDNLLELSCRDCTKTARREAVERGQEPPLRVLHRYDIAGDLIETVVEDT